MSRKSKKIKSFLIKTVPYVLIAWLGDMASYAYRTAPGNSMGDKLMAYANSFLNALLKIIPSFYWIDLLVGFGLTAAAMMYMYDRKLNRKKLRTGREHGSAEWGLPKDIEPFTDWENPDNNIILTKTERLTMGDASNPMLNRNKNVLVIGAPGTGKTYYFLEPNLMQMHSSYVVTDTKGGVIKHCGKMLENNKYVVKVFNTFEFDESMHYNPFAYFNQEKLTDDIAAFIDVLIKNTGEKSPGGDDFWINAEKLLYTAFIAFIFAVYEPESRNIKAVLDLVIMSQSDSEKSNVDIMFEIFEMWFDGKEFKNIVITCEPAKKIEEVLKSKPSAFQSEIGKYAIENYKLFKLGAKKTVQSILISCAARLKPFGTKYVAEITSRDDLELDKLGDRKTALFIIIDDIKTTYNFLVAIMYSQMFDLLSRKAYKRQSKRLKYHVRFLLDEFANCGQIPNFQNIITVIRSRGMSACVILQAISQLKSIYKDDAETIISGCDSKLFLGSTEMPTLEWFSKMLGKETIDTLNTSLSRGSSESFGTNNQKTGKELMTVDELSLLDGEKCILLLRGVKPFLSMKYKATDHERYRLLSYTNKKNEFNSKKTLKKVNERLADTKKDDGYSLFDCKGGER